MYVFTRFSKGMNVREHNVGTNLFIKIMLTETRKLNVRAIVGAHKDACCRLAPPNDCMVLYIEPRVSSQALPRNI